MIGRFLELLTCLADSEVDFVIIGGFASAAHGCTNVTQDIDICCDFSPTNLMRLQKALADLNPVHRMTSKKVKLELTEDNCKSLKNLYLDTELGQLDCLGYVKGVGGYRQAVKVSEKIEIEGKVFNILNIDALIESKKTMNRPRDLQTVIELKVLKDKRNDDNS
ncbi:MAG: nucleotidyltransferase [Planctomycetes bacterium]|nr:nucleotidyltransferase [Planctomycetota bacterium]